VKPDAMLVEPEMIEKAWRQIAGAGPAKSLAGLRQREPVLATFLAERMAALAGHLALDGAPPQVVGQTHEKMLTLLLTCLTAVQHGHFKLWKDTAVGTRLALIDKTLEARKSGRRPARRGRHQQTSPCDRRKEGQR